MRILLSLLIVCYLFVALSLLASARQERLPLPVRETSSAPTFLGLGKSVSSTQLPKPVQDTRILVGPNILVSKEDWGRSHAETMLAINPKDVKNLLGASIIFGSEHGMTCKTYASKDGGYTWIDTAFPERVEYMSFDPQVAFGSDGTAYFIMLGAGSGTFFYRSEDGGFTWEKARVHGNSDHPQTVVNHGVGKYAGRIYVSAMYGIQKLGIMRSEDDGKTFIGPALVPNPSNYSILNGNPLVFDDGTLFIPYVVWGDPGVRPRPISSAEFVTSSDGGISFSAPAKVAGIHRNIPSKGFRRRTELHGSFAAESFPVYAVDSRNNTDRLYAVWSDIRFGKHRLLFSNSVDRGKTWSAAKLVSPDVPVESSQYQPMLAINREGVIGISWFDTRDSKQQDSYHLYFTASVDRGKSFISPRRVSSEPSFPAGAGNRTPHLGYGSTTAALTNQLFRTQFERFGNGGDYMGFTSDAEGTFHPFWIDGRSGTAQVWTTRIQVVRQDERSVSPISVPNNLVQAPMNGRLALVTDPPKYDVEKQEAVIPMRLKNVSAETIYGPITVEVKNLAEWTILNAKNGQGGVGAIFDYSSALGDWQSLKPGAITEAVIWKFKYSGLGSAPSIGIEIRGSLAKKK